MRVSWSRCCRLALVSVTGAVALCVSGCGKSSSNAAEDSGAVAATGGSTGSGGTATGGTTGGESNTATGGSMGTGGNNVTGGTFGIGGSATDSGGTTVSAGGSTAGTGGLTTSGGTANSGGTTGRGGRSGTGGRSASGGSSATGGRGATPVDDTRRDGGPDAGDGGLPRDAAADAAPADAIAPNDDAGIPVPDGYELVWSDEFNTDGTPDPKNWTYEKGFARNEELQWYQPDNATVKDGLLVIEGRKERVANPNYQAGSSDWKTNRQYAEYTSTSMTTWNLQSWQYGRFEMRARIPTSAGMWPAWWTLGVSGEWPSSGEIDIMEYYQGNVLANVACGTSTRWSAKWDSSTTSLSSLGGSTWTADFHVWRMDWDDQTIDLYLDDKLLNSVPLASMLNADGTSPFKQKHYMLVNLAIGGANGGDPSGTTFPVKYEVDWIRVFRKL
jgi:beta-glucanase (GH16 family)